MILLLKYIRPITYAGTFLFGIAMIISSQLRTSLLIQYCANASILFLYFTLLASPLYATFPRFPARALYIKARQALGVSSFFFGLMHALIAFFIGIGGFSRLSSITGIYQTSIILAAIALFILTILAITSLKYFIKKLGRYWKPLHRLVYIAGIFILIHATLMGSDILNLSNISAYGLILLGIMEILRIIKYLKIRRNTQKILT